MCMLPSECIVDHAVARERALEAFRALKRSA
jgi:hypothetical protein